MSERLVIVGGVAAGMSAAAKARRTNPDLEIVVYERSGYVSYGACGFPYFIKGEIDHVEDLIARTPAQMSEQGVCVRVHSEVVGIDASRRSIRVRDVASGRTFTEGWDKLIIASGAHVEKPPLPGIGLAGVFSLRTVEDALAIRQWLLTERPHRGVILGAGYLGLEMAEALSAHGVAVTLIDAADQVMPNLDPEMAAHVQEGLEAQGVAVCLGQPAGTLVGPALVHDIAWSVAARLETEAGGLALEGDGRLRVREVVTCNGTHPADIVIVGIGTRPNVGMAAEAGIVLGQTGAIAVDRQQRTSAPDIWAAGAAAEAYSVVTHAPTYHPGALTANRQGRVAGTNAAGGAAEFGGVAGSSIIKAFDMTITHTGLNERYARALGLNAAGSTVRATSKAHYMPGGAAICAKLVYERGSGRVLGAQMVGTEGVAKRIDVVAVALQAGWTVEELAQADLSYSPPFGPVWDPVLVAANAASG